MSSELCHSVYSGMTANAVAHRQRRTWASHLCAQSVLLEKVTSLATDTAVVGVRVFAEVCQCWDCLVVAKNQTVVTLLSFRASHLYSESSDLFQFGWVENIKQKRNGEKEKETHDTYSFYFDFSVLSPFKTAESDFCYWLPAIVHPLSDFGQNVALVIIPNVTARLNKRCDIANRASTFVPRVNKILVFPL